MGTDGWYATDGDGWLLHANHASTSKILYPCPDQSSAKMATTAGCAPPWRNARHGHAQRTSPWDHDGQARNATCSHGSSTSQAPAEFQIYTNSQEPSSSGDARPDGCTRWSPSTTTSCAGSGPGASDCFYVGCCSSTGTEADVG